MKVEAGAVDGSLVDLEVSGVDDDAEGSADRERDAVDRAVGNGNKFDLEWVNFDEAAGDHFPERGRVEEAGFLEPLFYERQREARAVNGNVDIAKDIRQSADVILVAVREYDRFD